MNQEQKKWEAILENEGMGTSNTPQRPRNLNSYWSTLNYFAIVCDLLGKGHFETEMERQIWECHASGKTIAEITQTLNIKYASAARLLRKLRIRFGLPEKLTAHGPRQRPWTDLELKIVYLRTVERLLYREIAEQLGMKFSAVANRLKKLGLQKKRVDTNRL
jgi:hypothetical protein